MVNCMPVFIAREPYWQKRFEEAGVPIIGDDIKSQVGATISHRVLTTLFQDRGVHLDRTMQLNVGGNSDFRNMLERERLESKKISKTNAVTSMLDYDIGEGNVHVGPSDYVPWLTDRKWAYIRMEGSSFGDVPLNIELKLEVWDSPNSAGIVIDAVRMAKLALNNGISGALEAPSSYLMKSPPVQIVDSEAHENTERFIAKNALKGRRRPRRQRPPEQRRDDRERLAPTARSRVQRRRSAATLGRRARSALHGRYEGYSSRSRRRTASSSRHVRLDRDASRVALVTASWSSRQPAASADAWIGGSAAPGDGVAAPGARDGRCTTRPRTRRRARLARGDVENTGAVASRELGYGRPRRRVWSRPGGGDAPPTALGVAPGRRRARAVAARAPPGQVASGGRRRRRGGVASLAGGRQRPARRRAEPLDRSLSAARILGDPLGVRTCPTAPAAAALESLGGEVDIRQHEMVLTP